MRLLYISRTYAPGAFAGGELSVHTLLRELRRSHNVDVLVAADKRYTGAVEGSTEFEGVPIRGINHESRYQSLLGVVDSFGPNAILTQQNWNELALRLA